MSNRPHDALVREVFGRPEHARGELQHLLPPALSARIDWATLTLVPGTYVDEELRDSSSDLLFRVAIDGREGYLYLLFEHQSKPDPLLVFRQLKYEVRFWEDWLEDHPDAVKLPVVIPLLLSHGPSGWTAATRFEDLLDVDPDVRALVLDFVPRFRTLLDDLTLEPDDALRARAMTELGRLVLWCLKTARNSRALLAGIPRWAALFQALRRAPNGAAALALLWRYILVVHDAPQEEVLPALAVALVQEENKPMPSIAEQLVEKGRAETLAKVERIFASIAGQPLQKGHDKGPARALDENERAMLSLAEQLVERGRRDILLQQLQDRFGSLPDESRARIERAPRAALDRWAARILTAATLDEALDEPPHDA